MARTEKEMKRIVTLPPSYPSRIPDLTWITADEIVRVSPARLIWIFSGRRSLFVAVGAMPEKRRNGRTPAVQSMRKFRNGRTSEWACYNHLCGVLADCIVRILFRRSRPI